MGSRPWSNSGKRLPSAYVSILENKTATAIGGRCCLRGGVAIREAEASFR